MKKLYAVLVLIFLLFSCSESDDFDQNENISRKPTKPINALDPTKLARVVFYPGTSYEKIWFFYPNGLIKKITTHNGTLLQNFLYDANKNLIQTNYSNSNSYTFTYDNNNHITSLNGQNVLYDATSNQYIFQYPPIINNNPECPWCYDYADRREITLNEDLLIQNDITYYLSADGDYFHRSVIAGYNNGNMSFSGNWNDPTWLAYAYDDKPNPFKLALLPVCRAMAITSENCYGRFAYGTVSSVNNVIRNIYDSQDPENEVISYEYNSNNLPVKQTTMFYSSGNLEYTGVSILYYYQGDVIPN